MKNILGKNNGRYAHGMCGTRPYSIWASMLTRCNNKNYRQYKDYGGRGIKVCDKWRSFIGFWEDMQSSYLDNLTLDRVDNNKGYCRENCRWATLSEQVVNKRNSRNLTHNGKTQTVSQWIKEVGLKKQTVWGRIRRGWSVERILSPLTRKHPEKYIMENCLFNPKNN